MWTYCCSIQQRYWGNWDLRSLNVRVFGVEFSFLVIICLFNWCFCCKFRFVKLCLIGHLQCPIEWVCSYKSSYDFLTSSRRIDNDITLCECRGVRLHSLNYFFECATEPKSSNGFSIYCHSRFSDFELLRLHYRLKPLFLSLIHI